MLTEVRPLRSGRYDAWGLLDNEAVRVTLFIEDIRAFKRGGYDTATWSGATPDLGDSGIPVTLWQKANVRRVAAFVDTDGNEITINGKFGREI